MGGDDRGKSRRPYWNIILSCAGLFSSSVRGVVWGGGVLWGGESFTACRGGWLTLKTL